MGSVLLLLTMTGHEQDALVGVAAGALVNLSCSLALIPRLGLMGAAAASTLGLVTWNLILAWRVRHRLGLDPTALARG